MNKYPKYKPTNIPWLGDVPEHWELISNRRIFFERKEYNDNEKAELLSVSQYMGVTKKKEAIVKTGMHDAESLVGYRIVRKGDFVMNYMLAWNGSMGISQYDGVTSPAYAVFKIKDGINKWYLHYLLKTPFMNQYFEAFSTGMVKSRLRLYPDNFKSLFSFIPPLAEQNQIVHYLDEKLEKISKLTEAKKKQIELLREQKQAVINGAVTKGGEGWEKRRLRDIFRMQYGQALPDNLRKTDGKYSVFGANGAIDKTDTFNYEKASIIIGRKGSAGEIQISFENFWALDVSYYAVFDEKIVDIKWLYYQLLILDLPSLSKGVKPGLNRNDVYQINVCFPPLAEQQKIVAYLDKITAKIDSAIEKIEKEISLLGEYRTRLISDVVTGKMNVCNASNIPLGMFRLVEKDAQFPNQHSVRNASKKR